MDMGPVRLSLYPCVLGLIRKPLCKHYNRASVMDCRDRLCDMGGVDEQTKCESERTKLPPGPGWVLAGDVLGGIAGAIATGLSEANALVKLVP